MKYPIPRPQEDDLEVLRIATGEYDVFHRTVRSAAPARGYLYEYTCSLCGKPLTLARPSSRRSCVSQMRRCDAHILAHVNQIPEPIRKAVLAAVAMGGDRGLVREQVLGFASVEEAKAFFASGKVLR